MIVTKQNLNDVLSTLSKLGTLSFDSETTGLRPYSGDRVFSVIIGSSQDSAFYFNFNTFVEVADWPEDTLLGDDGISALRELFSQSRKWYAHNAIFDLHHLRESFGIEVAGDIFCTQAQGRIVYNDHWEYGLDASLKRIGTEKDDSVKKYVEKHKLKTQIPLEDKKGTYEQLHYERIPFPIITEYALKDAKGTFRLGESLTRDIERAAAENAVSGKPSLLDCSNRELALIRPLLSLERTGILLNVGYIREAIEHERHKLHGAVGEFESQSGRKYVNHFKTLEQVFQSERQNFTYGEKTKTGQINPTFDEETLRKFSHPLAAQVLIARDAQSRLNFYQAYLFNRDKNDVLHPQLNSWGTATGRFSSTNPNMQNITAESILDCLDCGEGIETLEIACPKCKSTNLVENKYPVRRAFIPRPDMCFFNPDYSAQEYRLMLDYAKRMRDMRRRNMGLPLDDISYFDLLVKIKEQGYDVHEATGEIIGRTRKVAKTVNFLKLFGGGAGKLAESLGIPIEEAHEINKGYFDKIPYVKDFIKTVISTAENRGYIQNFAGRRWYFDRDGSYRAPNYLIQGSCSDIMRDAMIGVAALLKPTRSNQLLSTHDELLIETHYSEVDTLPYRIIEIMESVYKYDYLPLTASAEWSDISLADKKKGFPNARAA